MIFVLESTYKKIFGQWKVLVKGGLAQSNDLGDAYEDASGPAKIERGLV
jgi:hypothetical protein